MDIQDIKVEFVPDKSNPPPLKTNNAKARKRNKTLREEIKIIMDVIKVGQSFKVFGLSYAKASSTVHGIKREYPHISLTFRDFTERDDGFVQVWRSA